jgi:uncharacterized protein YqfA (UPF0365 family)
MSEWAPGWFFVGMAVGGGSVVAVTIWIVVNRGWRHATFSGAPLPLLAILGMRLRGSPPTLLIDAYVALHKRGRNVDIAVVEAVYLANKLAHMDAIALAHLVEEEQARNDSRDAV